MYSLFRMLFRSTYWRMLLRGDTYREAGRSLRRVHKDRRARKYVLSVALLLLIPLLCAVYVAWLAGSGAIFILPFVLPVVWWRARKEREEATPLHIAPQNTAQVKELSPAEEAAMRKYLAELALCLAVIFDRAGSESFLKQKVLPEGVEVRSRRINLDLLQEYLIWDRMQPEDRLALMMADGHWEWQQINLAGAAMEPLRLLRWILRLDFYLPVIGQQLKGDYSIAHELVKEPARLFAGTGLIAWSEIETGREAARHFHLRCWAECIVRGMVITATDEMKTWASGVVERLRGRQDEDFVLGTQLVSEASNELLGWATTLAQQRVNFLTWAMTVRQGGPLPEKMLGVFRPEAAEVEEKIEADNQSATTLRGS